VDTFALGDPLPATRFNCAGRLTFADWMNVVLDRSFESVTVTGADAVLPSKTELAPVPHVGDVPFCTQSWNLNIAGGAAVLAFARKTGTTMSTTSGRKCRRRTRLVDPLASLDSLKMLTICPPYPGHD
jgi:hypothetical protein